MQRIDIIDSHTAGEPTRVVVGGGPNLGQGSLEERVRIFRERFDSYRTAIACEPRGSDVVVGALLCEPLDPRCVAGVIFFNNVGYLGMCGHGTIGLMATLAHLGRIQPGQHSVETPVGMVSTTLHDDGTIDVENVPSFRKTKGVSVTVANPHGAWGWPAPEFVVSGDVAWGGNWFYLVTSHRQALKSSRVESLSELAWAIRQAVNDQGFPEIDHVELFGPPSSPEGHARNFVLCPGGAYDRSPCGTGTSAKLACLAADGAWEEGQRWVQESIIGSRFEGRFRWKDQAQGVITPTITGRAHVISEASLLLDDQDPFCWGI